MINRLPADVPKSGKRYDLTLTSAGLDDRKRELAMFVIDNGDHRGVRVSAYLTTPVVDALIDAGADRENFSTSALDALKLNLRISAKIIVERLSKNSAGLYKQVNEDYNQSNVYCVYHLSDFKDAKNDTELAKAFEKKADKFVRKDVPEETDASGLPEDVAEAVEKIAATDPKTPSSKAAKPKPKTKRKAKSSAVKKSTGDTDTANPVDSQ